MMPSKPQSSLNPDATRHRGALMRGASLGIGKQHKTIASFLNSEKAGRYGPEAGRMGYGNLLSSASTRLRVNGESAVRRTHFRQRQGSLPGRRLAAAQPAPEADQERGVHGREHRGQPQRLQEPQSHRQ